jgi:Domain of unknown function (DU1801)
LALERQGVAVLEDPCFEDRVKPFADPQVKARFDAYPPEARKKLLLLRELVFRTAESTDGVGELEESLKWGEPAYATKSKAGSTVRMDWKRKSPHRCAMYFHCQTNLIEMFRTLFPNDFKYEGNRALIFEISDKVPEDALAFCIAASLRYHLDRQEAKRSEKGRNRQ